MGTRQPGPESIADFFDDVRAWSRNWGFHGPDEDDAAQEVAIAWVQGKPYTRYDPARGMSIKSFIFGHSKFVLRRLVMKDSRRPCKVLSVGTARELDAIGNGDMDDEGELD
jgi:hypothetical protein